MKNDSFSSSPLITFQRLQDDLQGAFSLAPPWVLQWALADTDLSVEENVVIVRVGQKDKKEFRLEPISFAVLCELTRFGNSVTTNTNGKQDDPHARRYLKLTFQSAAHDNMPVARIVMDAFPHQQVRTCDDTRELRPTMLKKTGGGKPTKAARAVAIDHAERMARKHVPEGYNIETYLQNILALFTFIDQVLTFEAEISDAL